MTRPGGAAPVDGVAFDLDGTLYPNYRFYARLLPFVVRRGAFLAAFGRARDRLRAEREDPAGEPFALRQARHMAALLRRGPPERLAEETRALIYEGWEPLFDGVRLYPGVLNTLAAFRERGLRLGLLSDFPLNRKLDYLGLAGLWDAAFCSEDTGHLKPDPAPFRELARRLDLPPERVLYVGNSLRYDVRGAAGAGMRTGWIVPWWRPGGRGAADVVFSDYRRLRDYVLGA